MFPDFKELLRSFHAHGVKYLIVGGYAVSFHAQPRATKDIDIHSGGCRLMPKRYTLRWPPLERRWKESPWMTLPIRASSSGLLTRRWPFDILPAVDGVDFDTAWAHRIEGIIDQTTGDRACFISKDDLIASKLAAGRARDLLEVEDIREAER